MEIADVDRAAAQEAANDRGERGSREKGSFRQISSDLQFVGKIY